MPGIKETKEVIIGLKSVKDILVKHLGDGFDWKEDVPQIIKDLSEDAELKVALDGADQVLPELKDLDFSEKISLVYDLIKITL